MAVPADTASIRTATEDVRACGAKPRTSPSSPGFFSKANAAFATRYRPDSRGCRVDGERAPAAIVNSRAAGFGAWLTAFLACVACVACVTFVAFEPVSGEEFNDAPNIASAHGAPVSVRRTLLASAGWGQIGTDITYAWSSDGAYSGTAVSISADGTRVAIGSRYRGCSPLLFSQNPANEGCGKGRVQIFDYDDTKTIDVTLDIDAAKWRQVGGDIDGGSQYDMLGASISISSDGKRVAIGAPQNGVGDYSGAPNEGRGYGRGYVRVYAESGGTWSEIFHVSEYIRNREFGKSVSISSDGTRVAVGSPQNGWVDLVPGSRNSSGLVRVYAESGGTWTQLGGDIVGEDIAAAYPDDQFGTSVALSADGTRVAIGAPNNDGANVGSSGFVNNANPGHVRVFYDNAGTWTQLGGDIDGEAVGDKFGTSVSISSNGMLVLAGAPGNDGNGADSGRVRAYELIGSTWTQVGGDIDGDAAGDLAGTSVSVSGDGTHLAVGADGHTRVYKYNAAKTDPPAKWEQVGSNVNSNLNGAGTTVSLSSDGSQLAMGDPGPNWSPGNVRIFTSNTCDASAAPTNGAVGDCAAPLAPGSGSTCTPTCDTGYTLSGDRACAAGPVYTDTVVCNANLPPPCNASAAPANGAVGDCTSSLASGSTCRPTCDTGYTVSGTSSCSLGVLTSATCSPSPCDASAAPANGGVGDCPSSLAPGSTCQPVCDSGYSPSGPTSCATGVLTAATCISLEPKWSNSTEFVPDKGTEHPSVDAAAVAIAAVVLFAAVVLLVVNVVDAVASLRRPRPDVGRDDGEKVGAAGDSQV